jgi:hypothetical protein
METNLTKLMTELRAFVKEAGLAARQAGSAAKHLMKAAIMGGRDDFNKAVDKLYEEIRTNANGLAEACNAEKSEDGAAFVIPGNVRTQVSQVQRALKFGVDLGTVSAPIGVKAMRDETVKAAEAAKAANPPKPLTGDDAVRANIRAALDQLWEQIKTLEGDKLSRVHRATADYITRARTIIVEAEAAAAAAAFAPVEKALTPPAVTAAERIAEAASEPAKPRVTVRRKTKTEARAS